jgi:hypothetical protein
MFVDDFLSTHDVSNAVVGLLSVYGPSVHGRGLLGQARGSAEQALVS